MGWEELITIERIITLHGKSLQAVGQEPLPVSDSARECVEARIGNAWSAAQYNSENTSSVGSGLCFAGYLMFYLVNDHCFPDGNKRIGWIAAVTILASLGLTIQSTDECAISLVEGIADNEVSEGGYVVKWLAERIEAPQAT